MAKLFAAAASASVIQSPRFCSFQSLRSSSSFHSTQSNSFHECYLSFSVHRGRTMDATSTCSQQLRFVRASSEGVPKGDVEDPKFVPLNADDPIYGPPALLLLGFGKDETSKVQQFLKDLDGEFLKVIHCTEEMLSLSVWEAMHTQQSDLESVKFAESLPRICILSGLTGEEMMMFINAFPEAGFDPAVFAALVPNSANKLLEEVVGEIMGDHEMMSSRQSE